MTKYLLCGHDVELREEKGTYVAASVLTNGLRVVHELFLLSFLSIGFRLVFSKCPSAFPVRDFL